MKIKTRYFGEVECTQDELVHFVKGLYGFDDELEYLLVPFSPEKTLFSMQSVKTPELAFVLMDPFSLDPSYAPVLQEEELKSLGVEKSEELFYYVLCATREPVPDSTVNMKCPIAINGDTCRAMQVILETGDYHMRHKLAEFGKQSDDGRQEDGVC